MANTYDTSPPPPAAVATETRLGGTDRVDVHHHDDHAGPAAVAGPLKRVSWGAIFAGSAIGVAVQLMLTLGALGIGLATIDPAPGGDGTPGFGALASGSGIGLVVAQLIGLLAGGYVAGRLAGVPFKQGSVLHGAAVWAVATIATFWLATTAVGAVAGGAASLLGKAGSGVSSAVQAAVPDDLTIDALIPDIDVNDLPPEVRDAMRERGMTARNIRDEAEGIVANVVSQQERARALDIVRTTATDVLQSPGDASQDVSSMVDQLFSGPDAVISDEDRQELEGELSARFDISEQEAQQTLERWQARADEAVNAVERNVVQARDQAAEAAQAAAEGVSSAAFLAFVASLLGLIAAAVGGLIGRPKDDGPARDARGA